MASLAMRRVVVRHHFLVRVAHWLTFITLAGLVMSGLSIYWASPVFRYPLKPWVYEKFGIGTFNLAEALALHWLYAYLFMLAGVLYLAGLIAGGGWRALMPRRAQVKYNVLQRAAYVTIMLNGLLIVASGWAMHKPAQLHWLERMFGSYDGARIVHFASMCLFLAFVVPHVVLAIAAGWDTLRSMIVGWSARAPEETNVKAEE